MNTVVNINIRAATKNDIATIQEIATITWAKTYTFLPPQQIAFMLNWMYSTNSLIEQMQNQHHFFCAELNNAVVGFASISKDADDVFKLNKLYVLPNIQKCGAGKALLKCVIDFAYQNKATEIQLQVNRNNVAKDFYLKNGFKILYEADFEIGNGFFMNDFVMRLSL